MHDSSTDTQLMLQVKAGETRKLGVLFEKHHVPLYNFFLRLTSDQTLSEDLVQESFLRMLKYRHTFRGDTTFKPWLFRLARNVCHDHYRKTNREVPMADYFDPSSEEDSPAEHTERTDDLAVLRAALAQLPEDRREVLILSRFHRLKYDEIASVLGCSVGAVKVRVHRAMKDLRTIYFKIAQPL